MTISSGLARSPEATRCKGFTLPELLTTLLLLALLLSLALPGYRHHVATAHRALAVVELEALMLRQSHFSARYGAYASSLAPLGFADGPYAIDGEGQRLPADDERGVYLMELSTSASGFEVSASPLAGQRLDTRCGQLSLSSLGVRRVAGSASVARCW